MNTGTKLVALGAMLGTAGFASAGDLQLQAVSSDQMQFLRPVKVAQVLGLNPDGSYILGEWIPYEDVQGVTAGPPYPDVIFDSFEGDINNPGVCDGDPTVLFPANGAATGGYDPPCQFDACTPNCGQCGVGDTNRWFFGPTFVTSSYIAQVGSLAAGAANVASFFPFAWFQDTGGGTQDDCGNFTDETVIIINLYDEVLGNMIDGATDITAQDRTDHFVDGIAFNFGPIGAGGYYFTNADVSGGDRELLLGIQLDDQGNEVCDPIAADRALEVDMALFDTFEEELVTVTAFGQPMLWGTKQQSPQGAWASSIMYMDGFGDQDNNTQTPPPDCNLYDGSYLGADGEFNDNNFGLCPNPLQPMLGLHGDETCGEGAPLCVEDATVLRGIQTGGSVDDTCASDDVRWTWQPDAIAATIVAPISLELTSTFAGLGGASSYTFDIETRSQTNGQRGVVLRIEVFNYVTGQYEGSVFPNIPDTDTVFTVVKDTNAGNYINDANGEVNVRVSYLRPQGVPPFWTIGIDQATWTIE